MGFSQTIASVGAIVSPTMVGALTPNETQEEWRVVFYITASIYVFGMVVYAAFASSDRQEWAIGEEEDHTMTLLNNIEYEQEGLLTSSN